MIPCVARKQCLHFTGSSNGRTPGFGPGYLGSSPSPVADTKTISFCWSFLCHLMLRIELERRSDVRSCFSLPRREASRGREYLRELDRVENNFS